MVYKKQVQQHFNNAATSYAHVAVLQKEIVKRLDERFDFLKITPKTLVDLGSGIGNGANLLYKRYPKANIIEIDFSTNMLKTSRQKKKFWQKRFLFCQAEAALLPLKANSVDIIFSNCLFQWCDDLQLVFQECFRVLKPNGLLTFSTFGPDTLIELKKSFTKADTRAHVNTFLDMHDLGDLLVHTHFSNPVLDMEKIILTYQDVQGLLRDLKGMGANTVKEGSTHLMGKNTFNQMVAAYESFRNEAGTLPATFEVVYGHAFKVLKTTSDASGLAYVPIETLETRE